MARDASLADYAETAWLGAQLDAVNAQDRTRQAVVYQERVDRGVAWLRSHAGDHPRYHDARVRLMNLEDRRDAELLAARCYERACWTRCIERHGFLTNAGRRPPTPEQMWGELMPGRPVPVVKRIAGCVVIEPERRGVAVWEMDELRELLATRQRGARDQLRAETRGTT